MFKKILLIILLFSFSSINITSADNGINPLVKKWFSTFSKDISKKQKGENEIKFYKGFTKKISKLTSSKKFTKIQLNILNDIIKLSNETIFKNKLLAENNYNKNILDKTSVVKGFKNISYNKHNIYLENGIWYTYKFNEYIIFKDKNKLNIKNLKYNGINKNKTLVFLSDNNNIGFTLDYKKAKLISDSVIFGISDKYNFLKEIKNDKKNITGETDSQFLELRKITEDITINKNQDEKIKEIYKYIIKNFSYSTTYGEDDYRIFSGIETFKNKNGVCEGYAKIFLYMLNFSNISDVSVERGYVIDAPDFPQLSHAWIKVGNTYYDPTFDDPIGLTTVNKFKDYKYYGLPKDLFYTNRFLSENLPEDLKNQTIKYRKELVTKNIEGLINKYKKSNYNIIKPNILKHDLGINISKKLNFDDLKLIVENYEVNNYMYNKNGKKIKIKRLEYYTLKNDNDIEIVANQLNYNFDGHLLFKWKLLNGDYEYRLGYNIIY